MRSRELAAASPPSSYDMSMHVPRKFLQASGHSAAAPPPEPMKVDSKVIVVLAALLCALVCVVGLALVARCAWLRRYSFGLPPQTTTMADMGLSRNALRSLPGLSFHPGAGADEGRFADCPICLAEFVEGEEVRVLPQCRHRFHVACVDPWLGSHSSCPSCRQVLVAGSGGAPRCHKCGARSGGLASPVAASAPAVAPQAGGGEGQGQGGW